MHRAIPILAVAFYLAILGQAPAAVEAEELNLKRTTELIQKPLGEINFPESTLEKRIAALRAIAGPLGIRLTLSKGVEVSAKRVMFPAITLKEANIKVILQYMTAPTKFSFSVRPGEVQLLLVTEKPNAVIKPKAIDEVDPFK